MGVGPSTKETTLHHCRDPLIDLVLHDPDLDLAGVIIIGSPDDQKSKDFLSARLGVLMEALEADGVLIHVEGFGNQHVDFASHMEEFGRRGIPAVGLTFAGNGLVVTNPYMHNSIIDLEKAHQGMETAVVSQNSSMPADVIRALRLLKPRLRKKSDNIFHILQIQLPQGGLSCPTSVIPHHPATSSASVLRKVGTFICN